VARLKVHKAMFGARVVLNGTVLGDHLPALRPATSTPLALRVGENEILIRVGAFRESVPAPFPGVGLREVKFVPHLRLR